jgi:hypothetical protein
MATFHRCDRCGEETKETHRLTAGVEYNSPYGLVVIDEACAKCKAQFVAALKPFRGKSEAAQKDFLAQRTRAGQEKEEKP